MKTSILLRSVRVVAVTGVGVALFVGVSGALADNSSSSNPGSGNIPSGSNSGVVARSWSDAAAEELATLPVGTKIVDCWPGVKQLLPGERISTSLGFTQRNPGFYMLSDGRCALDSSAVPTPIRSDSVDTPTP
jgi:hypothetical protein